MTTALIVFSVILVASVFAHYFFWRSSKKHYEECMRQANALNEKLHQLAVNDTEIDRMLDEAEKESDKMGKEIEALRSVWFTKKDKATTTKNNNT